MFVGVSVFLLFFFPQPPASDEGLGQTQFKLPSETETLLHIKEPARYSLSVKSGRGVALELVDRMAGPFAQDGLKGERDGRIDHLLDAGVYKVRLDADDQGPDQAALKIHAFAELNSNLQELEPLTLISSQLGDFQQRSFWVTIHQQGVLRLEVMGRNLKDCRLWIRGEWLAPAQPTITTYEPEPGKPMTHVEFHHNLPPGRYRLTCYGGTGLPWAQETNEQPLYLRRGIPKGGTFGKRQWTLSPFGRDVFQCSGNANFFEIGRSDKKETRLTVTPFSENGSRFGQGSSAVINKESRVPRAQVNGSTSYQGQWAIVSGRPGDEVTFQHFNSYANRQFYGNKTYWIATQHGLAGRDTLDATGILAPNNRSQGEPVQPVRTQAVPLGPGEPFARTTNLLGDLQLFIKVKQTGTYQVAERGDTAAKAQYRIEPFFTRPPRGYRAPPFRAPGEGWQLTAGLFVLTAQPRQKGILRFSMAHQTDPGPEPIPLSPDHLPQAVLWPDVPLYKNPQSYRIWVNQRSNIPFGVLIHDLPLRLEEPLPLTLIAGESVTLPLRVASPSRVVTEGGDHRLVGFPAGSVAYRLNPGRHDLTLTNTQPKTAFFQVRLEPLPPLTAFPPFDQDFAAELDALTEGRPMFRNFKRNQPQFFLLEVTRPGLYRLETTGRLAMWLQVRGRVDAGLFSGNQNGVGRNGLVQNYFRRGTYLVTVHPQGRSQGRAGLLMSSARVNEGSPLESGTVARVHLPMDAAVVYPMSIEHKGSYELSTLGLGKQFAGRLEDSGGFPILKPGTHSQQVVHLKEGDYRYYSLPEPLESRRLTTLSPMVEAPPLEGKGPHVLGFNHQVQHLWRTGDPDRFKLKVPARLSCEVELTAGMNWVLSQGGLQVAAGGGHGPLDLKAGDYLLEVKREEEDDRFPYRLQVKTSVLAAGIPQWVHRFPARLPVAIGEGGFAEIIAFGPNDVKGTLLQDGETLAFNDDGPSDWNFHIAKTLPPGAYTLEIHCMGTQHGSSEITLTSRTSRLDSAQTVPFKWAKAMAADLRRVPVKLPRDGLVRFGTHEPQLNWALSKNGASLAEGSGELIIPLQAGDYQLTLWPESGESRLMEMEVAYVQDRVVEPDLTGTTSFSKGYHRLVLPSSSAFEAGRGKGRFSPGWNQALAPVTGVVNGFGDQGWLSVESPSLDLDPLTLKKEAPLHLELKAERIDFLAVNGENSPMLLEVSSAGAILGCMAVPIENGHRALRLSAMDQQGARSFTGLPNRGTYRVTVWKTGGEPGPQQVKVVLHSFQTSGPESGFPNAGTLAPGASRRFSLPEVGTCRLTIEKGLVGFLHQQGQTTATWSAFSGNRNERFSCDGGFLTLVHGAAEETDLLFRLELEKATKPTEALPFSGFFEVLAVKPGRLKFTVPEAEPGHRIFLAGEGVEARLQAADGRILSLSPKSSIPVRPGKLTLHHGSGLATLWTGTPETKELAFLGSHFETVSALDEPLKAAGQRWPLSVARAAMVVVEAPSPGVTALLRDNRVLDLSVGTSGHQRTLRTFLGPGNYHLVTRPISGLDQTGQLQVTRFFPEVLPAGGSAPERLIVEGEVQIFQFEVKQAGPIGVGVVANSDHLQAQLLGPDLVPLAQGPMIYRKLDQGTYTLKVYTEGGPVAFRPVVYGLDGPGKTIPDEVLNRYLEK